MKGGIQGGATGGVARKAAERLLEREWVVAQARARIGEKGGGRLHILAAVIDGGGFAAAGQAVVLELDLHDRLGRARAARDAELLGEGELDGAGAELHGRKHDAPRKTGNQEEDCPVLVFVCNTRAGQSQP